jgi:hypothetical protein
VHQVRVQGSDGNTGPETHLDKLSGTAEFDHAYEHSALHSVDQRVPKEARQSAYAIALHFMYTNFVRIHQSYRVAPAMEAGLAMLPWTIEELVSLVPEQIAAKRGKAAWEGAA